jgi:hypothetical protein
MPEGTIVEPEVAPHPHPARTRAELR